MKTNPKLENKKCWIYTDIISPANATTTSFKYLLSFASTDNKIRWCETPLFPALFKKAGYNVIFYSNQYVAEGDLNFFDASAGFFNHPQIYNKLFSVRNHRLYTFDMDMVDEYERNRNNIEKDSLNLIIFHLHGQHSPAVERYPIKYNVFGPNNIHKDNLSLKQKEEISQYDNATLYNDDVVSQIINMYEKDDAIIIYFADHSEEIYDFREKAGRFFDIEKNGYQVARYQLEIPFIIFTSEIYRIKHPEIMEGIKRSIDYPFMIDDIPHLLLYLAGINTSWYIKERCILHPEYNIKRKRLISGTNWDYSEEKNKFECSQ